MTQPSGGAGSPGVDPFQLTIVWESGCERLTADAIRIHTADATVTTDAPSFDVTSNPGDGTRRTLEVTWFEHGRQQRMNVYFDADSSDRWVAQLRTDDGFPAGDWITYEGPMFRSPIGEAYEDEAVRLVGVGRGPSSVEIAGLTLMPLGLGSGAGEPVDSARSGCDRGESSNETARPSSRIWSPRRSTLSKSSEVLLDECFTRPEAIAMLTETLDTAGESGFVIRTDGPVGGPIGRAEAIRAPVDAGCAIYGGSGGTAEGQVIHFVSGG